MELRIQILHSIPGRLRFCFSKPLIDAGKLKLHVMEHDGIYNMKYSNPTRSMLVNFDEDVVDIQEILIRSAVAFSLENHLQQVHLFRKTEHQFITAKGVVAGLSIVASGISGLVAPKSTISKGLDWLSAVATSTAVLEHAGYDYRKKGSVDPEVLSLVFLANKMLSGNNLFAPSLLTWLVTFGRHFSSRDGEGILLNIRKSAFEEKNYEVNVSKTAPKGGLLDILNLFAEKMLSSETGFDNTIFEKSKTLLASHETNLEGIGEKVKRIILTFNQ